MKKRVRKKYQIRITKKNKTLERLKLVITGSLLFFSMAVITFAIILYSTYFFREAFLRIAFRVVIILMGVLTYYLLITEFITYYLKRSIPH